MTPFFPNSINSLSKYGSEEKDPMVENFDTVLTILSGNTVPKDQEAFFRAIENIINKFTICTISYTVETTKLKNYLDRPPSHILSDEKLTAGFYHLFCHCLSPDIEKSINFFCENLKEEKFPIACEEVFESNLVIAARIAKTATSCFCLLPCKLQSDIESLYGFVTNPKNKIDTAIGAKIFNYAHDSFSHLNKEATVPSLEILSNKEKNTSSSSSSTHQVEGINFLRSSSEAIPIPNIAQKQEPFFFEDCQPLIVEKPGDENHLSLSQYFSNPDLQAKI